MTWGQRTPEENRARGHCRELVREEGSSIRKTVDRGHVIVAECERWPQGLYLEFHGWCALLDTLKKLRESPQEKVA